MLLFTYVQLVAKPVYASTKVQDSRTIAIVFDNSGSMYDSFIECANKYPNVYAYKYFGKKVKFKKFKISMSSISLDTEYIICVYYF